eukprot:TRINITY_DN104_c0_g2_i1.p1 TRINITY_DN104_c0_g2~~TRINITY_DN104_c0_g2_i1.p1  ORF type:complete len:389 (+),score=83.72 TRINITY_DN104_c0_g2_i1:65-1231(+)
MPAMTIAATNGSKVNGRSKAAQSPTKLFIGGITKNTSTEVLRQHFCRYGRVLDCVAMRREDGRSRGFGYVTLDSSQAAECCLAAPQVIDGRVVDLKRAVPEGSMEVALKATRLRAQAAAKQQEQGASILSTPAPYPEPAAAAFDILTTAPPTLTMMWPGSPAQSHWNDSNEDSSESFLDCATLLSTSPTWRTAAVNLFLSTTPSSLEQWQPECLPETPTNASILSASAPEFIPKVESADEVSLQKPAPPRAALGDITNTHAHGAQVAPPPGLLQQADISLEPTCIPWQPDEEVSPTCSSLLSPMHASTLLSTTSVASTALLTLQNTTHEVSAVAKETRTISTQTEDEDEAVDANTSMDAEAPSISREDLLSLRSGRNGCNLGIRTMLR